MKKIIIWSILLIGLMLVSSGMSINTLNVNNKQFIANCSSMPYSMKQEITNITVQEAYNMLTNTGDGIQTPIDVRRADEWNPERIDTPLPEHPRWYFLDILKNETLLPKFLFQYDGCDIIIYCAKGSRSWIAAEIIDNAGFTGTIYNMVGGITEWKNQGLPTTVGGIYNITVQDVWQLCTSTSNGVQNLIDVRYDYEWYSGFLDTPWPECPIWHTLDLLKNYTTRQEFKREFIGNEVILYCMGGYRSLLGSYELYYDDFIGTQYNMLGGINDWIAEGLPIRNNTPPADPIIKGPQQGTRGVEYTWTFETTDPEGDIVYYWILWGDGCPGWEWIGPYASGEVVSLNHTYYNKGTYTIGCQAMDFYANESGWTSYTVKMPREREYKFNLLEWLSERFSRAQSIIKQLLGL